MGNDVLTKEKLIQQFNQKLNTIKYDLLTKKCSKVNKDFFYVSMEDGEIYGKKKFKMINLMDEFPFELNDFLKRHKLQIKKVLSGLYFCHM